MAPPDGLMVREMLVQRARTCIGTSVYRRNAAPEDAPKVLNCFRFTQWIWSTVGIRLPDQQLLCSEAIPVSLSEVAIADLVFVPRLEYALEEDDFGHVGIATDSATIVHATKWVNGVTEEPLLKFVRRGILGVRRIPEALYCRP